MTAEDIPQAPDEKWTTLIMETREKLLERYSTTELCQIISNIDDQTEILGTEISILKFQAAMLRGRIKNLKRCQLEYNSLWADFSTLLGRE